MNIYTALGLFFLSVPFAPLFFWIRAEFDHSLPLAAFCATVFIFGCVNCGILFLSLA